MQSFDWIPQQTNQMDSSWPKFSHTPDYNEDHKSFKWFKQVPEECFHFCSLLQQSNRSNLTESSQRYQKQTNNRMGPFRSWRLRWLDRRFRSPEEQRKAKPVISPPHAHLILEIQSVKVWIFLNHDGCQSSYPSVGFGFHARIVPFKKDPEGSCEGLRNMKTEFFTYQPRVPLFVLEVLFPRF